MKIGLVLEGGANRGVFTSGVLDYFMEQNLGKAFRYVIGTSAFTLCRKCAAKIFFNHCNGS